MDQVRQVRILIPPFFLLLTLLWNAYLTGHSASTFNSAPWSLVAAAGSALPLGYAIGAITTFGLRRLDRIRGRPPGAYEAEVSDFNSLWHLVMQSSAPNSVQRVPEAPADNSPQRLYAIATFDHQVLEAKIHEWLMRRWSAFIASTNSICAILLAQFIVSPLVLGSSAWTKQVILYSWFPSIVLIFVLALHARLARKQTMEMIEFQVLRKSAAARPS